MSRAYDLIKQDQVLGFRVYGLINKGLGSVVYGLGLN